ncbi:hypothetical protein ES703_125451 [subsurface metagenome]
MEHSVGSPVIGQIDSLSVIWDLFTSQLQDMKQKSKVDLRVVPTIQSLIDNCQENERWWAHNTTESRENNFAPYHAFRNIRLILKKVEEGLKTAEARNSNPIDVENALRLIPTLSSLHMFVSSFRGKTMNDNFKERIYYHSRQLRDVANTYSFLPNLDDEIRGINKRTLKSRVDRLSEKFQSGIET